MAGVADEPGVVVVTRRAGLARSRPSDQRLGTGSGGDLDGVTSKLDHLVDERHPSRGVPLDGGERIEPEPERERVREPEPVRDALNEIRSLLKPLAKKSRKAYADSSDAVRDAVVDAGLPAATVTVHNSEHPMGEVAEQVGHFVVRDDAALPAFVGQQGLDAAARCRVVVARAMP